MTPDPRRARVAAAAGSLLGFAAAVAISLSLPSRPAPGQLPGYALAHGFDPGTDVLRLVLLFGLPFIGGVAGFLLRAPRRRVGETVRGPRPPKGPHRRFRLATPEGPGLIFSAVAAHALTVWTFLVGPLSGAGLPPLLSLAIVAAISTGLAFSHSDRMRGAELLAAASPILAFTFLGPRPSRYWLAVGLAGLILPILARALVSVWPRFRGALRVTLLVVLLPGSVTGLVGAAVNRAPMVGDVFEDGHGLLPASEYRRGERPYRDIVPGHGLVSDGLLQATQIAVFGDDYRGLKRGTKVVGVFFLPAFYALGWVASGSAAVGFGGLVMTLILLPNYLFFRALVSIWTIVLAIHGSRRPRRSRAAWMACGAALPVGLCIAVDFTAYAAAGVAVALYVARGRRADHLRALLLGVAVSAAVIALALAAFGVLDDFAATTFGYVPSLLPVYALGFPPLDPPRDDPAPDAWLRSQVALGYAFLAISAIVSGALLPRAPAVGSRARGLLPVLAWIGAGMLSVIERHHVTYPLLAAPVCLLLLHRWVRGSRRWSSLPALASGLAVLTLVLGRRPWSFTAGAAEALARPWSPPGVRAVEGVPRARGAVFFPPDADLIEATARAIREAGLRPDETWLDFANAPGLYYLFDRDCPIRYYEVPFYESEKAQREVIAAIEANPKVRLVLYSSGLLAQTIDDIANPRRAPRVAAFLREHFRPLSPPGAVEFWVRKEKSGDPDGTVSGERP